MRTALRLRLKLYLRSLVLWAIGLEEEDRRDLVRIVTKERSRIMRCNATRGLAADLECSGMGRDADGSLNGLTYADGVRWDRERGWLTKEEAGW